jgi:hypothetical protein
VSGEKLEHRRTRKRVAGAPDELAGPGRGLGDNAVRIEAKGVARRTPVPGSGFVPPEEVRHTREGRLDPVDSLVR